MSSGRKSKTVAIVNCSQLVTLAGPQRPRVAGEMRVSNHISFVGGVPKSEVPERLSHADIFLNTTNVDNTPVSVLEAMACGLCVINTNVGGIPYMLRNEHDALLVAPNNAREMATAIRRVLCDPGLAARLSLNARREVEQFDWSAIFPSWQKIFLRLLLS